MSVSENKYKKNAKEIRLLTLQMICQARASHLASALSISDILAVLYGGIIHFKHDNPTWEDRDRFILSKGHACASVYATLAINKFFPIHQLFTYGDDHSIFMNHISHKVPGVEFSTGSLGHGLPYGTGKAFAAKKMKKKWRTIVLMSDGELDEGSNWESLLFAAHHKLDNLIAIIDYNKLQSLGQVVNTIGLEPLTDKFKSFGWSVREVDGHNYIDIERVFSDIPFENDKPSIVIAHTIKGKGISFMENNNLWHYKTPDTNQFNVALDELNHA